MVCGRTKQDAPNFLPRPCCEQSKLKAYKHDKDGDNPVKRRTILFLASLGSHLIIAFRTTNDKKMGGAWKEVTWTGGPV